MLTKITFTGIDNKTKIKDIETLYKKYPFIEFGFLVSESNTNKQLVNRYPDLVMLKGLKNKNIPLALHVCGRIAREIVQKNNWEPLFNLMGDYLNLFQRIQLNVAGIEKFNENITFLPDKIFIIQTNNKTNALYEHYKHLSNVVSFQDNSGGIGKVESNFGMFNGYAGGINSENVLEILQKITEINQNDFWIDMETSLRRNDKFDVKICEEICEKIVKNKYINI